MEDGLELTPEELALKAQLESEGKTVELIPTEDEVKAQKEAEEKEMQEFLASEENKANGLYLAQQIEEVTKGKWFTVHQLRKMAKLESDFVAFQKINMCKLFGFMVDRIGNPGDGPQKDGKKLFKVAITKEDRARSIDDVIVYLKGEIEKFELKKKIILADKKQEDGKEDGISESDR